MDGYQNQETDVTGEDGGIPSSPGILCQRGYIIATAPRTGSSLLAEALTATGLAGHPDEFFDNAQRNEAYWQRRYEITDDADYLHGVIRRSQTPNGMFGLKLHWHQIPALRRRLVAGQPDLIAPDDVALPHLLRPLFSDLRYVWLMRRNKVAQALSYYRATNSGVWRVWRDRPPAERPENPRPEYDYQAIHQYVQMVEKFDYGWRRFFQHHRIPALLLVYEDFVSSYDQTIRGVLRFLGLPHDDVIIQPPGLQRLANAEAEDWEKRYRAEHAGRKMVAVSAQAAGAETASVVPTASVTTASAAPVAARASKRNAAPPRRRPRDEPGMPLVAYDVGSALKATLARALPTRHWMDATPKRFAYRCLPMVIANQQGWMAEAPHRVEVVWDGTQGPDGLLVTVPDAVTAPIATSHFGSGILTFHIGYLFRTPPGYNMHVRGPANWPKDGVCALEGIVESDWTEATFTMNWKVTRPHHPVVFEPGEPIAMISPLRRGELEQFVPEIRGLMDHETLQQQYLAWSRSRDAFNSDLRVSGSVAQKSGWQKHYVRGQTIANEAAPAHQTGLALDDFIDRRDDGSDSAD